MKLLIKYQTLCSLFIAISIHGLFYLVISLKKKIGLDRTLINKSDFTHKESDQFIGVSLPQKESIFTQRTKKLKLKERPRPLNDDINIPLITGSNIFLRRVKPRYPKFAKENELETEVKVRIFVNSLGFVRKIEFLKEGGDLFDEEVIRAIEASQFLPKKAVYILPIVFKLSG